MTYTIKDWAHIFHLKEAANHKEISWTKFPVNRASGKYRRLMATPEGRTAYAVFIGLVRLAARANRGGVVDGTVEDVSFETGIPLSDCEAGMVMLVSPTIGWVVDDRLSTGLKPVEDRPSNGRKPLPSYSSLVLSSSSSSVGGPGEPHADIPGTVLYNQILRYYPKKQAIRGAYHATSEAVYRIANARHGGDLDAAMAWLGEKVKAYAAAKAGDVRWVMKPANWMEQGCYDDDPAAWQTGEETPEQARERMKREDVEFAAKEAARRAAK